MCGWCFQRNLLSFLKEVANAKICEMLEFLNPRVSWKRTQFTNWHKLTGAATNWNKWWKKVYSIRNILLSVMTTGYSAEMVAEQNSINCSFWSAHTQHTFWRVVVNNGLLICKYSNFLPENMLTYQQLFSTMELSPPSLGTIKAWSSGTMSHPCLWVNYFSFWFL